MTWIVWALVLVLNSFVNVWANRARNGGSLSYGAVASVASHGVWFITQLFLLNAIMDAAKTGDLPTIIGTGLYYTSFCAAGSTLAHWWSARYMERGRRRVGARLDTHEETGYETEKSQG